MPRSALWYREVIPGEKAESTVGATSLRQTSCHYHIHLLLHPCGDWDSQEAREQKSREKGGRARCIWRETVVR